MRILLNIYRIRYLLHNGKLKNKSKNGVNSYFKIYSTEHAILNDSDFSSKSSGNVVSDLTERNLTRTSSNSEI